MKSLTWILYVAATAMLVVFFGLAHPVSVQAIFVGNNYLEVGDAGDLNSPQFVTGGPYEGIVGGIDGAIDVDVFAFVAEFSSGSDPTIALYDFSQNSLGSASGLAPTLTINKRNSGQLPIRDIIADRNEPRIPYPH